MTVKTSSNGVELIKRFEGLRLKQYKDTGGVLTIGYGHTGYSANLCEIDEIEAEELLLSDIEWAETAVNNLVNVPLTQNQFDALVSFVFNLGEGQFRTSTLLKMLNNHDYWGAAKQLLRWKHDNGKVLKGLERRRRAEKELFMSKEEVEPKERLTLIQKIKRYLYEIFNLIV